MVIVAESLQENRIRTLRTLVIIPAFNEEASLGDVIGQIRNSGPAYQILVVNDASTDRTETEAQAAGAHVATLPFNLRIGAAVQTGFKYGLMKDYDIVAQVDGDGQHDPAFLNSLVRPILDEEADISVGSRYLYPGNGHPTFTRNLGIRFFSWLCSKFIGQQITDCTSGFRAMNRRAFSFFAENYPVDFPDAEALILAHRAGLRIVEVPVGFNKRNGGKSSLAFWRMLYYPIKEVFSILILATKS